MKRRWFLTGYEKRIDALIPRAEAEANRIAGSFPKRGTNRDQWADNWDAAFHEAMNRLTYEEGIRRLAFQARCRMGSQRVTVSDVQREAEVYAQFRLGMSFVTAVQLLQQGLLEEPTRSEVVGRKALIDLLERQRDRPAPPSIEGSRPLPPAGKGNGSS